MPEEMRVGTIRGSVLTSDNQQPICDAAVIVVSANQMHQDIAAYTNEDGDFILDELLPGDYVLKVSAEGFNSCTSNTHVEPSEITQLVVKMR